MASAVPVFAIQDVPTKRAIAALDSNVRAAADEIAALEKRLAALKSTVASLSSSSDSSGGSSSGGATAEQLAEVQQSLLDLQSGLAKKQDAIDLVSAPGFTNVAWVRRWGKVVWFKLVYTTSAEIKAGDAITRLPEGYRPVAAILTRGTIVTPKTNTENAITYICMINVYVGGTVTYSTTHRQGSFETISLAPAGSTFAADATWLVA